MKVQINSTGRFFGKSCYIPDCKTTPFQKVYDKLGYIDEESLNVQQKFIFAQVIISFFLLLN